MDRLWLLMAALVPMAWMVDQRDLRNRSLGIYRREQAVTWMIILVMGFFCGLRTWGNDTVTYLQLYDQVPLISDYLANFNLKFSEGILFKITVSLLKTIGFTRQDYLMFFAFATVIPYVWFVRRYSVNMVFGIFLMLATGFYTFAMAAIKQTQATAICLCAIPFALDRKWVRFVLLVLLGSGFHPYALVYLVVPFMMFEPWHGKTIICMILFMSAGVMLEALMGTVLSITEAMGAEYSEAEMLGEGVNIFRVAVCFAPVILAVFFGQDLFRNTGEDVHLMFNLAMVNALIMFVGLFGTANYFARLANYFLPAQVVVLPWMIYSAHPKDRRWLIPVCLTGYTIYFIYENAVIRPFDTGYTQMSLWDYLFDRFLVNIK